MATLIHMNDQNSIIYKFDFKRMAETTQKTSTIGAIMYIQMYPIWKLGDCSKSSNNIKLI